MIKLISLMYKKPELGYEEFYRYWKEKHGPLAARIIPGLRRYVQNHPVKIPSLEYEADGLAELWFDDLEAYKNSRIWRQSNDAKPLLDDEDKFMVRDRVKRYVVEEHVIIR